MKQAALFFLLLIITSCSCNQNQYQKLPDGTIRKPEIVNEYFSETPDSMLIKCQDLHGFGPFIIGKTTFKEASRQTKIFPYETNRNDFYGSYSLWSIDDYDIAHLMENDKRIKRLDGSLKFKIGELEFNDIVLAFYNDTLVAITFDPEYDEQILKHYINEYGNGDGHKIIENYFYKDYSKDRYYSNIEHTWYNKNVKFTYKYYFKNSGTRTVYEEEFLMIDNTGKFEKFLEIQQSIVNAAHAKEKDALQESFDLL